MPDHTHRWLYNDGLGNFWMVSSSNQPAERRCMDCGLFESFRPTWLRESADA